MALRSCKALAAVAAWLDLGAETGLAMRAGPKVVA